MNHLYIDVNKMSMGERMDHRAGNPDLYCAQCGEYCELCECADYCPCGGDVGKCMCGDGEKQIPTSNEQGGI